MVWVNPNFPPFKHLIVMITFKIWNTKILVDNKNKRIPPIAPAIENQIDVCILYIYHHTYIFKLQTRFNLCSPSTHPCTRPYTRPALQLDVIYWRVVRLNLLIYIFYIPFCQSGISFYYICGIIVCALPRIYF